jgi:Protein ENHANCED DISEASE RESISTANCE 2, C-terminal
MRIKVGESKSKHAMNDDINTSAAATKNDALSTAATEEDDLDLDDGGGAAADIQANGPTIAVCGKAGGDCHLPTFSPAPTTDAAGTTASNKKSTVAKNCYSQPPLSLFSVRGPTYMADQKKIASGPYLLASRGLDLFLTDKQHPVVLDQM